MALYPVPARPAHAELNKKLSFQFEPSAMLIDDLSDSVDGYTDSPNSGVSIEEIARGFSGLAVSSLADPQSDASSKDENLDR